MTIINSQLIKIDRIYLPKLRGNNIHNSGKYIPLKSRNYSIEFHCTFIVYFSCIISNNFITVVHLEHNYSLVIVIINVCCFDFKPFIFNLSRISGDIKST